LNGKKTTKGRKLTIPISDEEHEAYVRAAAKTRRSIAGFVRYAALLEANEVNRSSAGKDTVFDAPGKSV
jgi:uncharacterized protein (DUF1778 family)